MDLKEWRPRVVVAAIQIIIIFVGFAWPLLLWAKAIETTQLRHSQNWENYQDDRKELIDELKSLRSSIDTMRIQITRLETFKEKDK